MVVRKYFYQKISFLPKSILGFYLKNNTKFGLQNISLKKHQFPNGLLIITFPIISLDFITK
ncbi:MAG: hypothetical protein D8M26_10480 [Ignavibacteriae bacterium]|nr:MAG: hypothetical protein EDM72_04075 [Chlorobiota bacterium]MBL1123308.1 hypothetical protein [Ignavibacteriota bacterium]MCE7857106.1 hypothetical protein [Ignavibacteria bacterium CHB3]